MSIFDKARNWYNREISIELGVTTTRERRNIYDKDESVTWVMDTTERPVKLERLEESRRSARVSRGKK